MMSRIGVTYSPAAVAFKVRRVCCVNIIADLPVWYDPVPWCRFPIPQMDENPECRLVQCCRRRFTGPASERTRMPRPATPFCFDLNTNCAGLGLIAGHDVDLRHVSSECYGMRSSPFYLFHDKGLTSAGDPPGGTFRS